MGSKWFTGGVVAAPRGRIQFDFIFNSIRYRPSIKRLPQKPTFVELANVSNRSNSRSAWAHFPSRKSSPTTACCVA
jgi:hypothetical protein